MLFNDPNWIIFYSGLGLIVVELILGVDTGFDFLLIGLSLIVGSLGGFLFDNYLIAIVISIIISVLYMVFGRKVIKEKLHISTHKTNIDALMGTTAIVTKDITKDHPGRVKVANEVWRAEADKDIKKNSKVKIISVEGVTLKVA